MGGAQHLLWELLSDFLFFARDLAALAAEIRPLPLPLQSYLKTPPLQDPVSEKERAAYKRKYAECATGDAELAAPVIGHYLYRIARPGRAAGQGAAPSAVAAAT